MLVRSILSSYSRLLAGASLALLAVVLAGCNEKVADKPAPSRPVLVATTHYEAETPERSFVGTVKPRIETDMGFRVPGKVAKRLVEVGDTVEVGQPLATLDEVDLKLQAEQADAEFTAATGVLAEFDERISSVVEIRELVENYNSAAVAVREARENLQDAYIEFVGSLANALDARDRYTAGHSKRVSDLASATAAALQLHPAEVERIRIGALLHDIGKIGVADSVLQKTGRLTDEEFALVKEHPVTGRRILEGVQGLAPFIPAPPSGWGGSRPSPGRNLPRSVD